MYRRRGVMRGRGAYVENAIVSSSMPGRHDPVPVFSKHEDGGITISNREYVTDVYAPLIAGAFQNTTFPINPGMEKTFPWLCQIAENYDEYTLKQCIFTYKSSVAEFASASGQVGQVLMATQYNAAQAPFADKITMMQYAFAVSGKTSEDMLQGVECDPTKISGPKGHFVRNGPVPAGYFGDLNNYDHGVLNLAVGDCPATYAGQQMGELWVSYTVELRKPKFVTANGWGISRDVFVGTKGDQRVPFSNGANLFVGQQNSIGVNVGTPSAVGNLVLSGLTASIPSSWVGTCQLTDYVCFYLTFPSYYSGNVCIKYVNAPDTGVQGYKYGVCPTVGSNMKLINDIPSSSTATSLTWAGVTLSESGIANAVVSMEMHVRVDQSISGAPNVICFTVPTGTVLANNQGFYLDIAEYNRIFNYKQDGSNDRIVLVSGQTGALQSL